MYFRKVTLLLILCVMSFSLSFAHNSSLDLNSSNSTSSLHFSNVEFRISGTSNVRDWDIVSDTLGGIISFGPAFTNPHDNYDNPSGWLEQVLLYIPNHSLESGNTIMNQTMNKSLKSETHDILEYKMSHVEEILAVNDTTMRSFLVNGVVGAAGALNELTHKVHVRQLSEESFQIFGDFSMKMTDLDIEPPTFMRGALTTAVAITVDYKFTITFKQ